MYLKPVNSIASWYVCPYLSGYLSCSDIKCLLNLMLTARSPFLPICLLCTNFKPVECNASRCFLSSSRYQGADIALLSFISYFLSCVGKANTPFLVCGFICNFLFVMCSLCKPVVIFCLVCLICLFKSICYLLSVRFSNDLLCVEIVDVILPSISVRCFSPNSASHI